MYSLKEAKNNLLDEIEILARKSIIEKLHKEGINYQELKEHEFEALVADEKEILKSDSKKVGLGVGIGIAISLLTGI